MLHDKTMKEQIYIYILSLLFLGVVDGCKSLSEYLSYSMTVYGGEKKQYNEKQCIERCREDNLCFAMDLDTNTPSTCWLFRKLKDSKEKFMKGDYYEDLDKKYKLIIFFDALKLLDYSFKLGNTRVKNGVTPRKKSQKQNEIMCMKECKEDAICSVFTYKQTTSNTYVNCLLYSLGQVSCDDGNCKLLEKSVGWTTQFNVY